MRGPGPPIKDRNVAAVFASFPEPARAGLLALRRLIYETAASKPEVGELEEALKWGQPAYLTPDTKSGSTIRLGVPKGGGFAIYTNCQTTILSDFRERFPDGFRYEGNRAVHFEGAAEVDPDKLSFLIGHALTYHLRKRTPAR